LKKIWASAEEPGGRGGGGGWRGKGSRRGNQNKVFNQEGGH